MKQEVPRVGKQYEFYDDGKIKNSRRYTATIVSVRSAQLADSKIFTIDEYPDGREGGKQTVVKTLKEIWEYEVKDCYWLFAEETDYFIEASIPKYDKDNIWFARTKDGGWFSMDIQNFWQGGRLDVDGSLTKILEGNDEI